MKYHRILAFGFVISTGMIAGGIIELIGYEPLTHKKCFNNQYDDCYLQGVTRQDEYNSMLQNTIVILLAVLFIIPMFVILAYNKRFINKGVYQ